MDFNLWIIYKTSIYKVLMSKCGEEKTNKQMVQDKKKESTYFFSVCECSDLRSSSKVAGFLCYLQCTLQILIKELTPEKQE